MRWPGGSGGAGRGLPRNNAVADRARRPGQGFDPVEVDARGDLIGKGGNFLRQIGSFARLHEAEMPILEGEFRAPRQPAEALDAGGGQTLRGGAQMAFAGNPVQDDAGDFETRIEIGEAPSDGAGRLGLAGNVDREHDRYPETDRDVRRRTGAPRMPGDPIEQSHGRFDNDQAVRFGRRIEDLRHMAGRHGPAVDIGALGAAGSAMERSVDIVRAAFQGAHPPAARGQRGDQAGGKRRFSGAGPRRADKEGPGSQASAPARAGVTRRS